MKLVLLLLSSIAMNTALAGNVSVSTSTSTQGRAGDSVARQTGTLNVYTTRGGTQVGATATTVVTGGVAQSGSGNIIANGTRGSSAQTSYGVGVTIPFGK